VAGNLRLEELKPGPAEVREVFAQLVALEAGGWKGQAGSALAVKPALSQFFQGYVHRAAERGRLRVTRLWIGDVTAAAELAVEAYGRRWGLKLAYDEQFARWAPALQVVHASIKACTDRGLTAYEFLGSAESWQKRWKPEERRYAFTVMYPLSGRAAATAVKDLTSMLARRFRSPMRLFPVTT
jgi:CelD/BcsL family acetyltransferase involved in cellulose biosynthesis